MKLGFTYTNFPHLKTKSIIQTSHTIFSYKNLLPAETNPFLLKQNYGKFLGCRLSVFLPHWPFKKKRPEKSEVITNFNSFCLQYYIWNYNNY